MDYINVKKSREEKATHFLDRVKALGELAEIDKMGLSALTSHKFLHNLGDTENAQKIRNKCIDYLCTHPNQEDLDDIKGVVKGEESNFSSSTYEGGKKSKANRAGP